MKFIYIITQILIFVFSNQILGQQVTFTYILNTDKDFTIYDINECENNNIYIVGKSALPYSKKYNGIVLKLNRKGKLTDSINIKNDSISYSITNILPDSTNRFILSVTCSDTSEELKHSSINLFKMDTGLMLLEHKKYYFPDEYTTIIQQLRKGLSNHFLITGTIKAPINKYKMYLYVLNQNFDSLKAKIYLNEESIFAYDVKELTSGNFWILRGAHSNYANIDSNLNMISTEQGYIPHFINANYGLKWDSDTSFYLAGDYFPELNTKDLTLHNILPLNSKKTNDNKLISDHDIGFIKQYHPFDSTGSVFNCTGAKDTLDFPAYWGALDYKNKDTIFIGSSKNLMWGNIYFGQIPSWFRLVQTDSMLNIRWERFYGEDVNYNMSKLIATNDGGCIMAGTRFDYINHPNLHKRDIFILKVNSEGLLTSSNGKPSPLVHNAIVYPNPGKNTIRVRVAVQYKYSLFRLFNINGKVVITQNITGNSAIINTDFLPSGTYIYKITGKNGLYESGKWIKKGD